jgi:hypothetical protein
MATKPKITLQNGTVVATADSVTITGGDPTQGGGRTAVTQTTVTTTTKQSTFDNGVIDISIVPFMRPISIDFVGVGLKPQRKVWFFFDDVDVTDYIVKPDIVDLSSNSNSAIFNAGVANVDSITSINSSNTGTLLSSGRIISNDDLGGSSGSRLRRLYLANTRGSFAPSTSVTGSRSANTGTISSYIVRGAQSLGKKGGSSFSSLSSNTLVLHSGAKYLANNYWGTDGSNNVIIIPQSGGSYGTNKRRAARANVIAYNNVTQQLTLSQTFQTLFPNESSVISANNLSLSFVTASNNNSDFYVTREGTIAGTFMVPPAMFRTGERVFRIIDTSTNDPSNCTTRAEYKFDSSGLQETKNHIVLRDTTQKTSTVVIKPAVPARPPQTTTSTGKDPLSWTFFVNQSEHPNGMFTPEIEIWFRSKDEFLPATIQLRQTVNGYPDSYNIIPGSVVSVAAENIVAYEDSPYETGTLTPKVGTSFKFNSPIYLAPGEYSVVLLSPSVNYEIWIAELGGTIVGSTRKVSEQPYIGSFFKSQNGSTWDASQLEDPMFRIYKCVFGTSGQIIFNNVAPSANLQGDMFYTHAESSFLQNTSLSYAQSFDSGTTYTNFVPDSNFVPSSRTIIDSGTEGKYRLKVTMTSTDSDVSPILYNKHFNLLTIENIINNANISNADITITNEGSGWVANSNVALTISGGGATVTAIGYAIGNTSGTGTGSNGISSIIITDGGAGYINTANITVLSGSNTQILSVSSELNPSGGPIIAKHVSKVVTLKEGFDSGDLRVWLTAYKPTGTDIRVYYKIRNSLDPISFEKRPWVLMEQKSPPSTSYSLNSYDNKEYEYRPYASANSLTYTSGTNTYRSFNQYAIKIALISDNTVIYPVVYDMRAIALPAENAL